MLCTTRFVDGYEPVSRLITNNGSLIVLLENLNTPHTFEFVDRLRISRAIGSR